MWAASGSVAPKQLQVPKYASRTFLFLKMNATSNGKLHKQGLMEGGGFTKVGKTAVRGKNFKEGEGQGSELGSRNEKFLIYIRFRTKHTYLTYYTR